MNKRAVSTTRIPLRQRTTGVIQRWREHWLANLSPDDLEDRPSASELPLYLEAMVRDFGANQGIDVALTISKHIGNSSRYLFQFEVDGIAAIYGEYGLSFKERCLELTLLQRLAELMVLLPALRRKLTAIRGAVERYGPPIAPHLRPYGAKIEMPDLIVPLSSASQATPMIEIGLLDNDLSEKPKWFAVRGVVDVKVCLKQISRHQRACARALARRHRKPGFIEVDPIAAYLIKRGQLELPELVKCADTFTGLRKRAITVAKAKLKDFSFRWGHGRLEVSFTSEAGMFSGERLYLKRSLPITIKEILKGRFLRDVIARGVFDQSNHKIVDVSEDLLFGTTLRLTSPSVWMKLEAEPTSGSTSNRVCDF